MVGKKAFRAIKRLTNVKAIFRRLSLRTQLLLILLFILLISISSLSIISARSEELIIDKVTDDLDDITKAIQISVEELTYRGDSTQRLKSYVDMLNRKGIKEISIISDDAQVIASSNPKKIGTTENPKKIAGQNKVAQKKNLIITAKLGEESRKEGQRLYNVIMPVSIKGQNLGYIHISMILDDYRYLAEEESPQEDIGHHLRLRHRHHRVADPRRPVYRPHQEDRERKQGDRRGKARQDTGKRDERTR